MRVMRGCRLVLVFVALLNSVQSVEAQQGAPGITKPVVLAIFDPAKPRCAMPPGLSKVLAFAQDNERKFMQGVARGLQLAAKDRELDYRVVQAANDPARMIEQIK